MDVGRSRRGDRSSPSPQTARDGAIWRFDRARERSKATTFTEVAMPWYDGPYKGRLGRLRICERTRLTACVRLTNETLVMLPTRQ
jgi:hypothetical protein